MLSSYLELLTQFIAMSFVKILQNSFFESIPHKLCDITVTVHNNFKCEIINKAQLSLFENYLNYETIIINSGVLRNNSMKLNEFLQAAAYCLDPLSITMIESFE